MRASRYIIFMYVAMVGAPFFMFIYAIAYFYNQSYLLFPLQVIMAILLSVYGILGINEVYISRSNKHHDKDFEVINGKEISTLQSSDKETTIHITRFDTQKSSFVKDTYSISSNRFTTVLDALLDIKSKSANTLAIRYSCRMGICGSCGMVINGKPSLACETNLSSVAKNGEVNVEPMRAHHITKDLVTDLDDFFAKHKSIKPGLFRKNEKEKFAAKEPYAQSTEEIEKYLPYSYCIMCGLCLDACPVVNTNEKFIGPQALSQEYRYHADSRDQLGKKRIELTDTLEGVWGCEFIGACSKACPKGVDPATSIQLLKIDTVKNEVGME